MSGRAALGTPLPDSRRKMHGLSASELLAMWERGLGQPLAQQALWLLVAAEPEMSLEALAQLSIGQRDARLLDLHEWLFGTQLVSVAGCAQCRERLELTFDVTDIRLTEMPASLESVFQMDGYDVHFRVPNSADLLASTGTQNIDVLQQLLLARCTLDIHHNNVAQSIEQLPEQVVAALTQSMAQADPQADVQLQMTCPACGCTWLAMFDIASFLWSEINDWAQRLLSEIHVIASAYGWREADIVAMSAQRRQWYVDRIGGLDV